MMKKNKEISGNLSLLRRCRNIFSNFRWYDYAIIGFLILLLWFLFLFDGDLWHTSNCSLAYLNGHFADFYEYNTELYLGLDYYPLIYVIFAIFNIPLKILGIVAFAPTNTILMLYEKVLCGLFLLGTTVPFYLLCKNLGMKIKNAWYSTLIFLTTPFIFVSTFGWGMYDSLSTFFLVLGLYLFLREKKKSDVLVAMLIFGLACSIKMMGLFIVIPMVAYRYKNIFKLAWLYFLTLLPIAIQILLYMGSPAFSSRGMGASTFIQRLFGFNIGSGTYFFALFIAVWAAILLFAYFTDYEPGNRIKPIYIAMISAISFFCLVEWHPQWFILLSPFLVLTTVTHKKRNRLFALDVVFAFAYFTSVINKWPYFFERALQYGGLKRIFITATDPYISNALFPKTYLLGYEGVMVAFLLLSAIIKNPWKHADQYQVDFILEKKDRLYAYARFLVPVAFYLFPIALWAAKVII